MMIFYPFSVAAIASGFIGLILMLLGLSMPLIACTVLDFYAVSTVAIYFIFNRVIRDLGMQKPLLGLVITMSVFAIAFTAILLWRWMNGSL